jgi:hypothetical protein
MTLDRREFLTGLAATGMLAAMPGSLPIPFTDAERDALRRSPDEEKWDMSWTQRLRGKSRAVFDSPNVGEGGALFRAILWRTQYHDVLGIPLDELTPVVVFRHQAIPLIMNDEFWDHLGIGHDLKWKDDATGRWTKKNPLSAPPAGMPAPFNEMSIPQFIAAGGIVLGCGLAFEEIVGQYRAKDSVDKDEAKKRAKSHLIPGVILQPSGFFAALKAQDEGCKYFLGS